MYFPLPSNVTSGINAGVDTTITCDASRSNPPVSSIVISRTELNAPDTIVEVANTTGEQTLDYLIENPAVYEDTGTVYICNATNDVSSTTEMFDLLVQGEP